MSFIVPFEKPAVMPASGMSWFTGKVAKLSLLAVTQAVLISVFALLFLQLKVESNLMFILFSIGVSLTFLMIILLDRKSTRLNSSHVAISYAVFCLKKKK